MGIFSRLFKVAESNAHSALDKIEDPIKMTEQGIRDLKKDLHASMQGLAQAKAVLIRMRKDSDQQKTVASNYEKKAILLLNKAQAGDLDADQADRLASEALAKKEEAMTRATSLAQDLARQEQQTQALSQNVSKLKTNITQWENELTTLKARSKVATAQKKINKQLSAIDSSSTVAMLEKMKNRVNEDEALAEAYGEMNVGETSIDDEINKALGAGAASSTAKALETGSSSSSSALDALKAKLKAGS